MSPRRDGALLKIGWSSYRYVTHPRDDGPLKERLREIAQRYLRYGYRRAWALLVRAGEVVSPKRVYRLWKRAPCRLRPPTHQFWTYDFLANAAAGGKLRLLTSIDEFTRECLDIAVARSLLAPAVLAAVSQLFA